MEYRLAEKSDIDDVVKLVKAAIVQMEADGIYQWDLTCKRGLHKRYRKEVTLSGYC